MPVFIYITIPKLYFHRERGRVVLEQRESTYRGRVRMALLWRPRFLAALSLTGSVMIACKAGCVAFMTYQRHRREDPDFAAQCDLADDLATQRLHDACFASAVEGDMEPIFWQGIKVGHVRKFDSRLRIEMLRARMPGKFKQPGASVNIMQAVAWTLLGDSHSRRSNSDTPRWVFTLSI